MDPNLQTIDMGYAGPIGSVEQRNRVLRNTYWLLALSMVPTVLGAWIGVTTGALATMGAGLSTILFLGGAFGFIFAIEKTKNSAAGVPVLLAFTFFMGLMLSRLLSFVLGLMFVLGQANEYHTLVTQHGTSLSSSPYGTVFYLTTGFHGLHVIGGLVAFLFLIGRTKVSKFTPAQATSAIVVSYYWHFVDVVWIGLFTTIYIIR